VNPDDSGDFKFVVDAFNTGQLALAHAKNNHCDLIITAQLLPDMSGTQLLGELQNLRPDAARILISNNPDKPLLSKAINEVQVHSLLCLYWNTTDAKNDINHQALEMQQLKTAVMQALTSRDLLLENQRLAKLIN
jgi:response regulator RpfG family c-di-GMP phosphodiesterase